MNNNKPEVAIIGMGCDTLGTTISDIAKKQALTINDIITIDLEASKEKLKSQFETLHNEIDNTFLIKPVPHIPSIYEEKQFICKGLHQYKENKGEWMCQCGKKL